jgi:peptidoglycan/LPS O-acetylase OafA/YrhL
LYYIDWLRATAVIGVVLCHCVMNSFDALKLNSDENVDIA